MLSFLMAGNSVTLRFEPQLLRFEASKGPNSMLLLRDDVGYDSCEEFCGAGQGMSDARTDSLACCIRLQPLPTRVSRLCFASFTYWLELPRVMHQTKQELRSAPRRRHATWLSQCKRRCKPRAEDSCQSGNIDGPFQSCVGASALTGSLSF